MQTQEVTLDQLFGGMQGATREFADSDQVSAGDHEVTIVGITPQVRKVPAGTSRTSGQAYEAFEVPEVVFRVRVETEAFRGMTRTTTMRVGTTNQETGDPNDLTFQASAKAALGDAIYKQDVESQGSLGEQYKAAVRGMLDKKVVATFQPQRNNPSSTRIVGAFKPVGAAGAGGSLAGSRLI